MKHEFLFNALNHGQTHDQWDNCIFDRVEAERYAQFLRDNLAAELRKAGLEVECFTIPNQRQRRDQGGFARVELEADIYGLRYDSLL